MSRRTIAIGLSVAVLFASFASEAKTYWNGTHYVDDNDGKGSYMRRTNDRNEYVAPVDIGVQPADYTDKASFLKAYVDQELSRLTPAQRAEDRRTLGG